MYSYTRTPVIEVDLCIHPLYIFFYLYIFRRLSGWLVSVRAAAAGRRGVAIFVKGDDDDDDDDIWNGRYDACIAAGGRALKSQSSRYIWE